MPVQLESSHSGAPSYTGKQQVFSDSSVIPEKAGSQDFKMILDSGRRRNDGTKLLIEYKSWLFLVN
jgi:hypothetical protein